LTRFWNWQDAPADTAPGIGMVQLPTTTPSLTTGVTAPNSLTNLPPLINNLITAPQPNTALLQAMGQQATSQPDFSPTYTGQQQLASLMQSGQTLANQARSDALKTSQTMASQAMQQMTSLVGAAIGGGQAANPLGSGSPGTGATTGKTAATTGKKGSTSTGQTAATATGQTAATNTGGGGTGSNSSSPLSSVASAAGKIAPLVAGAAE
jgi:hypothetical protein